MALLEVRDLVVRYGAITAVKGVSLEVDEGEVVCLIGPNGAGKTTTLLAVSGILRPAAGEVRFAGRAITGLRPDRIVRLGAVQVPENRGVLTRMTVYENLLLGADARDGDPAADLERVFARFPILRQRMGQRAGTLSGGEQQMLVIGRALMARPRLLMLDEPSLGLGPRLVEEIYRIIGELRDEGTTILLVEQNARKALATATRGYVMEVGRIVLADRADRLAATESVRRAYLGG